MRRSYQWLYASLTNPVTYKLVRDEEIANWRFVRDVREYAQSLAVPYRAMLDKVFEVYGDLIGIVVDESGTEFPLETIEFEVANIDHWFRDLLRPIPPGTKPYVRREAWERFRSFATIMRALAGEDVAKSWGQMRENED